MENEEALELMNGAYSAIGNQVVIPDADDRLIDTIKKALTDAERLDIKIQDERKQHAEEYARLRSTYLDAAAVKDRQNDILEWALGLAIDMLTKMTPFKSKGGWHDRLIQKAQMQKQEENSNG